MNRELDFWKDRRVLVTGHTGFKGSWLCRILLNAGARVTGFAMDPRKEDLLYDLSDVHSDITDIRGDIRDYMQLEQAFEKADPEIVLHLAAQPIVRESYRDPRGTYETNVMGTVNLLECVRRSGAVQSVLNVTTDKVYLNREWVWGYREDEMLDGFDPYSNSKSCSELVTHSYVSSFFAPAGRPSVSTARAGNVIGGGDFARDRIIPDCIRAVTKKQPIAVRNPYSVRPYQHVLEPLMAYLLIAQTQCGDYNAAGWYNVGPGEESCVITGRLTELFVQAWGENASWTNLSEPGAPHEASFLKLDCSKIRSRLGWHPVWTINRAVEETVCWTRQWLEGGHIPDEMDREIHAYLEDRKTMEQE